MPGLLASKTALVTGASRNVGRAIARRLARSGALVAVNYAGNDAAAAETLALIEKEGGKGFLLRGALGTHETAYDLAARLAEELKKRSGDAGLDILVNNVGGGDFVPLDKVTPEVFEQTFSNNVGATFWMTQALNPTLRNNGRVINISSGASRLALNGMVTYSMAKAAVDNFTRSMAKELGKRGITVNSVLPGSIETDRVNASVTSPELLKQRTAETALGKPFGQAEDIADLVHALATPELGWVTGQMIESSGGFRI